MREVALHAAPPPYKQKVASHEYDRLACALRVKDSGANVKNTCSSALAVRELVGLMREIVTGLGFVMDKTKHALARELDHETANEVIEFNKKLQAKSRDLLPKQLWELAKIATVRGSTNTAQLKCLKLGGVRTPYAMIRLLWQGYRTHALYDSSTPWVVEEV